MPDENLPGRRELILLWVIHIGLFALLCWGGVRVVHAVVSVVAFTVLSLLTGAKVERYRNNLNRGGDGT